MFPKARFLTWCYLYVAIYADDTSLYSKCEKESDYLRNLHLFYETPQNGAWSGLLFPLLEKPNLFHLSGLVTFVLLMWKWVGLFLDINHLYDDGTLSSKFEWSFFEWVFCLLRLLFISVNLHFCHVWTGSPCSYLDMSDKPQKLLYRTVVFLDSLAHCWNIINANGSYSYYFVVDSSELDELVSFHFCITMPRCYKDILSIPLHS